MQARDVRWSCVLVMAVVLVLMPGCGKKGSDAATDQSGGVVASVNGKELTQAELDKMVALQLASMKGRVPDDQLEQSRDRMAYAMADQFVVKVLLEEEADRQGFTASQEEIDEAVERIKANLPEGQTLESLASQNPRGEAGLMEDIATGMKINKLLEKEVKDRIEVTDDEIDEFMKENADRLNRPERVRARHILIKTDADDDAAVKAEKKAQLEGLRQEIADGADFAEVATAHSACPSSQKGGDLGFFTRGRMAKPFEDAAFMQEVNELGPVIETQFGYHIIEVTEKQPAGTATREEVASVLEQQKQQSVIRDYVRSLRAGADIEVKGRPLPEE